MSGSFSPWCFQKGIVKSWDAGVSGRETSLLVVLPVSPFCSMGMRNYFWLVRHRAESPSPVLRNHCPSAWVSGSISLRVYCNNPVFNRIGSILSFFYVFPTLLQFLTNHTKMTFSVAIKVILFCQESISKAMHCFSVFWPQVCLKYIFALKSVLWKHCVWQI